jgi:hypothetical protein
MEQRPMCGAGQAAGRRCEPCRCPLAGARRFLADPEWRRAIDQQLAEDAVLLRLLANT